MKLIKKIPSILGLWLVLNLNTAKAQISEPTPKADTTPILYFIIDSSRSMWGRMNEKPKVEIAKKELSKLIEEMPENVYAAVTTFGHRKTNDCTDIEEIVPIGYLNRTDTIQKINDLNPIGKSPLSDSIEFAVKQLQGFEGPKTIILVSDGVEACDKDPCQTTKNLKAAGINFTIEIIGFDLNEEEAKQLNCIADASGGALRKIAGASEVLTSLKEVEKKALEKPRYVLPVVPLASSAVNKKVPTPTGLKGNRKGNGHVIIEHEPWLLKPFYWRLIDKQTGEEVAKYSSFEENRVPAGHFLLAWRQYQHGSTEIILSDSVVVEDNQETKIPLNTALKLIVPSWVKPPRFWGLQDRESKEQIVTFSTFEAFLVPPGFYEVIWRQYENQADTVSFGDIEIEPGKTNYFKLNSSVHLDLADWLPEELYYWGLKDPETSEWVSRFYGPIQQELVPPGKYMVVYRQSELDSTDSEIGTIELEDEQELSVPVNTGIRLITKDKRISPEMVEFAELDADNKIERVVKLTKSLQPMPLKPGKYRVSYVPAGRTMDVLVLAADEVEIKAGEIAEINLDDILHSVNIRAAN